MTLTLNCLTTTCYIHIAIFDITFVWSPFLYNLFPLGCGITYVSTRVFTSWLRIPHSQFKIWIVNHVILLATSIKKKASNKSWKFKHKHRKYVFLWLILKMGGEFIWVYRLSISTLFIISETSSFFFKEIIQYLGEYCSSGHHHFSKANQHILQYFSLSFYA